MESIRNLINSAVLDPVVKGGLRWPLGYASSGNRFCVVGVWHLIAKAYKNPSMRLKVRHADRFDFRTSTGEASREISLKLKSIISLLQVGMSASASFFKWIISALYYVFLFYYCLSISDFH